MKRLICVLLTLALLCAVPVLALPAAAAGEADYDALYVQDGMTMWLDAYNPAQSINFTTGQWTSKVGSGSATLATPSFWTAAQGGGVGFAMHSYETFRDNYTRVGVDLGIANLPSGNFTVEFVYRMDGLVDEAGQDIPHNTEMNGNKWGLYTANQSAWVFGAAHFMQFMKSESPSGASLRTRLMYGLTQAYDNAHWLNDFTNFTEKNLHKATRHRVTYEQTEGGTYGTTAHYQWYNGENRVVDFCNETTTDPDGQAYYSNAEGGFKLMYGTPGVLYEVRVYNRLLTEAEIKQNYFADLCKFYELDIAGFNTLPAATKAELYDVFYGYDFTLTEVQQEELENLLTFYAADSTQLGQNVMQYEGLSARLEGDAPGVRSVWKVNRTLIALLEKKFTVRYGAMMGLAECFAPEELTVTDTGDGFAVPDRVALRVIYSTDGDYGATCAYIEENEQEATFAYTTYFGSAAGVAYYEAELVYRGFVAITDVTGHTDIYYTDAIGNLFGSADSVYGTGASLREMAEYCVNVYDYAFDKGRAYNRSVLLRQVLAECGVTVLNYEPGRSAQRQVHVYVDPAAGTDTAAGTQEAPVKTLAQAYVLAKQALAGSTSVAVTFHLMDGTHRLAQELTLDRTEIGAAQYWLNYMGTENAVLTGNRVITPAFTQVAGKPYYVAQLPAGSDGAYPFFRFLYVDGAVAKVATQGYDRYAEAMEAGAQIYTTGAHSMNEKNKFYLTAAALQGLTADQLVGAEIHLNVEWEFKIMHIARVDFTDTDADGRVAVYVSEAEAEKVVKGNLGYSNRIFWLENRLAFLDEPGEYYYDRASGKLYYYPETGKTVQESVFEIPQTENLLVFKDIQNLTMQGITFTGCDVRQLERVGYYASGQAGSTVDMKNGTLVSDFPTLAAVYIENVRNACFDSVRFRALCGDGLNIRGAIDDLIVDSCTFTDIGQTALRLGNGNAWSLSSHIENAVVSNNYMDNIAWYLRLNCALYVSVAKDTRILHNTIKNCSYTGISAGWKWSSATWKLGETYNLYHVEIAYNYIENFMSDMADGGAIYTLGGNVETTYTETLNTMHHNYVVPGKYTGTLKNSFINGTYRARFMPLYHDGASSNWHSYNNVVAVCGENPGLASFYLQIGSADLGTQQAHNLLIEENYFTGVNWQTETNPQTGAGYSSMNDYLERQVFWNHTRTQFNSIQRNNHCLVRAQDSAECLAIMAGAGCAADVAR